MAVCPSHERSRSLYLQSADRTMYSTTLNGRKNRANSMALMIAPCIRLVTPPRMEKMVCEKMYDPAQHS